jgi:hypothetical protein
MYLMEERELSKYQKKPIVSFVVIAFRYGGFENTFPIGSFTTLAAAEKAAADHRMFRGGKYEHRIYQFETDKWDDDIGHATNRLPCISQHPTKGAELTFSAPKPEGGNSLQEENRHLKDQLATLSKMHAKDLQRLSDMIDFRDNAIRKLRDAKGRHHTMLATRALFDIVSEECSRDGEN